MTDVAHFFVYFFLLVLGFERFTFCFRGGLSCGVKWKSHNRSNVKCYGYVLAKTMHASAENFTLVTEGRVEHRKGVSEDEAGRDGIGALP